MASGADQFLSSFNRIEKRLRDELDNPRNMGFSEMVRRLSKSKNINVRRAEDDLLQMAQLRNAIVHEKSEKTLSLRNRMNGLSIASKKLNAPYWHLKSHAAFCETSDWF